MMRECDVDKLRVLAAPFNTALSHQADTVSSELL